MAFNSFALQRLMKDTKDSGTRSSEIIGLQIFAWNATVDLSIYNTYKLRCLTMLFNKLDH
jgi:hypothetical protein